MVSEPPNKGMKLTSAERIGRWQLMPGVGRTWRNMGESSRQPPDIDARTFLAVLSPKARRVVKWLRRVVRGAAPEATETVLWGGLSYHLAFLGGRVKGAVCQIGVRGNQVELGFIHGVLLPDPTNLLRGTGKSKRSMRVARVGEYPEATLASLVRSAVEIRPDGFITPAQDGGGRPTTRCS